MTEQIREDIDKAVEVLKKGGVILYPTDTIWGIGCDATNPEAVKRVYEIKRRDNSKALVTLIPDEAWLDRYVEDVPEVAWQLIEVAVEPLTIVYDHGCNLASNLLADDGSVGIRVSRELYSSSLCRRLKRPIVSTSANISGAPSPACFRDISDDIIGTVDYVASYRREDATPARPSSVIKLGKGGLVKILR